ncbi:hypothetical protein Cantr_00466 [Candida viswanathii]|uniref:Nucleoporin Nup159/Nup146 N-terminal domain-containing protein n=1 Tax=Candida viswanathii TaxID=5486 RepID=A0A367YGB7_9ASCO|nr:hypothetical protein Cantr_00466 [Candida viswanathii]
MSVEETVSEDLGFKLNTEEHGIPIFDALDLENLGKSTLNCLPENHNHRHDFKITQLHFANGKLFMLDDSQICTLTIEQLRAKDFSLQRLESGYVDIAPSSSGILALTPDNDLHLESKKVASNKIALEDVEEFCIVDIFPVGDKYLFAAYDRIDAELDDHEVRTYLLEESGDEYTGIDIDIAPAFSSTARTMTTYHANLFHWYQDEDLSLITSSLATDVGILETATPQVYGQSEDINRAQFPLDEDTGDDCSPIGFAVSLHELSSKVVEPCPGVDDVTGKLPRVYALLHTGHLVSWWIYHKSGLLNDRVSLQKAIEYASKEQPVAVQKPAEAKPAENPFGSTTAGAFGGFNKPKLGQTSITKSDSESSLGPTLFGSSATGTSSGFGSTGFAAQKQAGSSAFGSSGFGSSGFGKSSFGQSGFGKSATSGASGFAKFANAKTSIFGDDTKLESPSASTPQKESPFGKLAKNEESPFGSLGKTGESPFGKLDTAQRAPFGELGKPEESPFAGFGKKEGALEAQNKPLLETATEAPPVASPSKFTPNPFAERAKAAFGESPFKALSKETREEEEFEEETGEESEEDSEGSESFVEVSVPASPVLPASTSEEGRLEDLSLSDQAQSTKREIPEIEEATEGLQQVKLESKPAEFLVYAGFTKPSERPSSNEIINQTISIIETTEGNLQIAGENGKLLSRLELAQARVPLVERTQELKATLLQLNNLSADIQKSYGEKIKVDKLYSQLALIAENKVENTPVLKGRPLDIKDDFMRTQLRKKVAQINRDMQKLLTMLMPWKAKNSMNPHTIDNIERIVFQINEQILDRTEDVDKLVSQLDKLEIDHKKDVKVTSNSSKLKLRKKLKQTTSIMY